MRYSLKKRKQEKRKEEKKKKKKRKGCKQALMCKKTLGT